MSILSVDTIQPIGSGSTVTLNAAKIVVGTGITFESNGQAIYAGIITATSFSGTASNASGATGDFSIADKIVHTGDTNTAIRFPTNDTITFETSGIEKVRIQPNGRVGIGTDNPPDCTLTVCEFNSGTNIYDNIALRLQGSTGQNVAIQFTDTTGAAAYIAVQGDALRLGTNNAEKLRIDSSGRILIGTTQYTTNKGVVIYGESGRGADVVFQNANTGTGTGDNGFYVGNGTGAASYVWNYENADLHFATNNAERLRIDSSGNVTTPNNPAFATKGVGGSWVTLAGSGDGTYSLGNTAHSGSNYNTNLNWASNNQSGGTDNRGSHWNNTAARFTAPVAGYYHFDINLYVKYSGQKTLHMMPYVGTTFTGTYDSSISTVVGGSNAYVQYPRTNRSINVYLTANNTFEWKIYAQTSIDVYPNYCWISGYLIG